MFRVHCDRIQHAVGHGGFHTGFIKFYRDANLQQFTHPGRLKNEFSYVYDCGSEQDAAFNPALLAYGQRAEEHTDLLFISHLHADHLNGIDRLQGYAPAQTVVLPYLDAIDRLEVALADVEKGAMSFSLMEYFAAPVDWFTRRGVKKLIFLEPPRSGDTPTERSQVMPNDDGEREGAVSGGSEGVERGEAQVRIVETLRKPRASRPYRLQPVKDGDKDLPEGAYLAGQGSCFQLEQWSASQGNWIVANWLLLPYVHPVDTTIKANFKRAVVHHINAAGRTEETLTALILEHLVCRVKRKQLMKLYSRYFPGGHNAVSMSMYSGPKGNSGFPFVRYRNARFFNHVYSYEHSDAIGWLSTGDAELKSEFRRIPWLDFYRPFFDDVLVMTLPHHGSFHNFHSDILAFANMKFALATTVERLNRVAQVRRTLESINTDDLSAMYVDDRYETRFELRSILHNS